MLFFVYVSTWFYILYFILHFKNISYDKNE